jgi:hypothetical protein
LSLSQLGSAWRNSVWRDRRALTLAKMLVVEEIKEPTHMIRGLLGGVVIERRLRSR